MPTPTVTEPRPDHLLSVGYTISGDWWGLVSQKLDPETPRDLRVYPKSAAPDLDRLHVPPEGIHEGALVLWLREAGWPQRTVNARVYVGGTYSQQHTFPRAAGRLALWGGDSLDAAVGGDAFKRAAEKAWIRFCTDPQKFGGEIRKLKPAFEAIGEELLAPAFRGATQALADAFGPWVQAGIEAAMAKKLGGGS